MLCIFILKLATIFRTQYLFIQQSQKTIIQVIMTHEYFWRLSLCAHVNINTPISLLRSDSIPMRRRFQCQPNIVSLLRSDCVSMWRQFQCQVKHHFNVKSNIILLKSDSTSRWRQFQCQQNIISLLRSDTTYPSFFNAIFHQCSHWVNADLLRI